MLSCTNCEAQVEASAKFCPECGEGIQRDSSAVPGESNGASGGKDGGEHRAASAGRNVADEPYAESVPVEFDTGVVGRRVGAVVLDFILVTIILALPFAFIDAPGVVGFFLAIIGVVVYHTAFESWRGQTPGKMVLGIQVVNGWGEVPTLRQAAIRNVVRVVDMLFNYLVGIASILGSDKNQRLGDVAAKTLVVRSKR